MKPSEYIRSALRTEPKKYRFKSTGEVTPRMEHAVVGLVTEAGEMMDAIKKSKFYGKELDKTNLVEELGDIMWYSALLCDELKVTLETVWDKNIRKLRARFPEKYDDERAENRDLRKERKELEK